MTMPSLSQAQVNAMLRQTFIKKKLGLSADSPDELLAFGISGHRAVESPNKPAQYVGVDEGLAMLKSEDINNILASYWITTGRTVTVHLLNMGPNRHLFRIGPIYDDEDRAIIAHNAGIPVAAMMTTISILKKPLADGCTDAETEVIVGGITVSTLDKAAPGTDVRLLQKLDECLKIPKVLIIRPSVPGLPVSHAIILPYRGALPCPGLEYSVVDPKDQTQSLPVLQLGQCLWPGRHNFLPELFQQDYFTPFSIGKPIPLNDFNPIELTAQFKVLLPKKIVDGKEVIPKPRNCWIIYREETLRHLLSAHGPVHTSFASQALSLMWNHESKDVKNYYVAMAHAEKLKHQELHGGSWKCKPRPKVVMDMIRDANVNKKGKFRSFGFVQGKAHEGVKKKTRGGQTKLSDTKIAALVQAANIATPQVSTPDLPAQPTNALSGLTNAAFGPRFLAMTSASQPSLDGVLASIDQQTQSV